MKLYLPRNYNKTVKPVPLFDEIGSMSNQPHRCHLDNHLNGEEGKNTIVQLLLKINQNKTVLV